MYEWKNCESQQVIVSFLAIVQGYYCWTKKGESTILNSRREPFYLLYLQYEKNLSVVTYVPQFSAMWRWSWLVASLSWSWSPEMICDSRQGPGWPLGLSSFRWGLGGGSGGGSSGSSSSLETAFCEVCYSGKTQSNTIKRNVSIYVTKRKTSLCND